MPPFLPQPIYRFLIFDVFANLTRAAGKQYRLFFFGGNMSRLLELFEKNRALIYNVRKKYGGEFMNNIESYVNWRGDISFDERPLNEVDNIVFCTLSYLDMKGVLGSDEFITLRDLYARIMSYKGLDIKTADKAVDRYRNFLFCASQSDRFGNVIVSDYVDIYDESRDLQFSAAVFHTDKKHSFIAFRGTDETLVGWKEDFIMSFSKTAAQDMSLKYTKAVLEKYKDNTFFLGGHSKGGNLALYTASNLSENDLERINHIYINDGPGLCEDVFTDINIERIRGRTTKIIPEFCVIGKLFDTQFNNCKIIKSSALGMLQHDPITWTVEDGGLKTCHENSPESVWINQTLGQWLGGITIDERKKIVDSLFDFIKSKGIVTLQDFSDKKGFNFKKILSSFIVDEGKPTKHKFSPLSLSSLFGRTFRKIKNAKIIGTLKSSPAAKAAAIIFFGILFLVLPETFILVSVAAALFLIISVYIFKTVRCLVNSGWDFKQNQSRVYTAIALVTVYAIIILKQNALFILSSTVFGIAFLCTAYNYAERVRGADNLPDNVWFMSKAMLFALMGLSILVVPSSSIVFYSVLAGLVFVADGIYRFIRLASVKKGGGA